MPTPSEIQIKDLIQAASGSDFDVLVEGDAPNQLVLVYFWAQGCAPCLVLKPMLEALVTELDGKIKVFSVDADQEQALCARFQVKGLPSVKIFRQGQLIDEFFGALPKASISKRLGQHLGSRET